MKWKSKHRERMKRRWLALIAFAVVLAGAFVMWFARSPGPLERKAAQIRLNMTQAEVQAILGIPDDKNDMGGFFWFAPGEGLLFVRFHDDIVVDTTFRRQPFFKRIRVWLGL